MVNRVVEASENLSMKFMGGVHKDFNIVIKSQKIKQSNLCIWEETSVQWKGYFRCQEAGRNSKGCIPGIRKRFLLI